MDFDCALTEIGEFGWYQRKLCILISLSGLTGFYQMLVLVFAAATPTWTCPEVSSNLSHCKSRNNCCSRGGFVCDGATFTTNFTSIATEWNLLCGERYKNELAQAIFMAGTLVGAPLVGGLADKHGRRKLLIISYFLSGGLAFLSGISPSYSVFVVLRFVVGMFAGGGGLIAFVSCTESIGPSYRGFVGTMLQVFFALAVASLGLLAYLIQNWRNLIITTSLPTIFGFFIIDQLPESPRWLASQGRYVEAEAILQKMALENGSSIQHISLQRTKVASKTGLSIKSNLFIHLFKNRCTCPLTVIMIISWFVNSLVYYGLSLNVKNLGGNMYVNFILAGLVEIPSYVLAVFLLNWSGRRKSLFYFMMGAAGSCYMCMKLQQKESHNSTWLPVTAMLGKFFISASFAVVYVYAAELFPTVIRNIGMGVVTVASRIGAILCPFVVLLGEQDRSLPMFIFACMSLAAGLAGLKLPETKGRPMPETVKDLEREQLDDAQKLPI